MMQTELDRGLGPEDCWAWPGRHSSSGYGIVNVLLREGRKTTTRAHRLAYVLIRGDIPEGAQLDHLCRNRGCWNPWHLEPVTPQQHVDRSWGHQKFRTHCPQGHPLSGDNLRPADLRRGFRVCLTCHRERKRLYYRERKRTSGLVP